MADYNVSRQILLKHTVPPHDPKFPDVEDITFFRYNETQYLQAMLDNPKKAYISESVFTTELPLIVQFDMDALDDIDQCGDPEDLERGDLNLHFYMIIKGNRYSTPCRATAEAFLKYCGYTVPEINLEFEVVQRIQYLQEEGYC